MRQLDLVCMQLELKFLVMKQNSTKKNRKVGVVFLFGCVLNLSRIFVASLPMKTISDRVQKSLTGNFMSEGL